MMNYDNEQNALVYGLSRESADIFRKIHEFSDINVIGFIKGKDDSLYSKNTFLRRQVYDFGSIHELNFDYIFCGKDLVREARTEIKENKLNLGKMVSTSVRMLSNSEIHNCEQLEKRYPTLYSYLIDEEIVESQKFIKFNECFYDLDIDYTRIKTLELISKEITADTFGSVAELGVFWGEFAKYINRFFLDRKMYLFDTFEGFDLEEAEKEMDKGHCDQDFVNYFKNTSIDIVLSKMPFPDEIVINKGFFPGTAKGYEEERFVFVSIDVDFEKSIYEGLEFFYPRLVEGGYIMLHDYNHKELSGVKNAVKKFESEYGKVIKVPIADECGTLVITK